MPIITSETSPGDSSEPRDEQKKRLDCEKIELEKLKLQTEIQNLKDARSWWWNSVRGVKLSEWFTALAVGLGLFAGYWTGWFNASRERLAAEQHMMTVQKITLQADSDRIVGQIATKEKELEDLKAKLQPFAEEDAGYRELKQLRAEGIEAEVALSHAREAVSVTIRTKSQTNEVGKRESRRIPAVREAILAANRIRHLKALRICDLVLTPEDLAVAVRRPLVSLTVERAGLTKHSFRGIQLPESLTSINLRGNMISSLSEFSPMPSITNLSLEDNPIDGDALKSIEQVFPNVRILFLDGTNLTDVGLGYLTHLSKLACLSIETTSVTDGGLKHLLKCRSLYVVSVALLEVSTSVKSDLEKSGTRIKRTGDRISFPPPPGSEWEGAYLMPERWR